MSVRNEEMFLIYLYTRVGFEALKKKYSSFLSHEKVLLIFPVQVTLCLQIF